MKERNNYVMDIMNIIKNSQYYILVNDNKCGIHKAIFYDSEHNFLDSVSLKHGEFTWNNITRMENMLDPNCIKFRPKKIKIICSAKLGKVINYYDKHNNIVFHHKYTGPKYFDSKYTYRNYLFCRAKILDSEDTNYLTKLIEHERVANSCSDRIDFDWILHDKNIIIKDNYQKTKKENIQRPISRFLK